MYAYNTLKSKEEAKIDVDVSLDTKLIETMLTGATDAISNLAKEYDKSSIYKTIQAQFISSFNDFIKLTADISYCLRKTQQEMSDIQYTVLKSNLVIIDFIIDNQHKIAHLDKCSKSLQNPLTMLINSTIDKFKDKMNKNNILALLNINEELPESKLINLLLKKSMSQINGEKVFII